MGLEFTQPIVRRAEDSADTDDVPAQLFALADQLRSLNAEATHLLSIVTARQTDVGRTLSRVQSEAVQIQESSARLQDSLHVLTRSLRAAGRL